MLTEQLTENSNGLWKI